MKVLENQTLYQCEFCGKRLLTPHGAKLHEESYCRQSKMLADKGYEILRNRRHEWRMQYSRIPGEEHLMQPDHEKCIECEARDYLVKDYKGNIKPRNEIQESELTRIAGFDRDKKLYDFDF